MITRIVFIIVSVVAVVFALLYMHTSNATVDISCDDFATQGGAVSTEMEVDTWADLLTVTLCSNPTTGFKWELTENTDEMVLEYKSNEYLPPEATGAVGAGGKEIWTFKPLKHGESTISMKYGRSWEGGEKEEWTFTLTATVK
ncbi:protease inhibitor I42 family protein [Chloroflexota bacterium]